MDVENIRQDFPILQKKDPVIYFDNAAMTLRPVQVINAIKEYYEEYPACAGRSIHKLAQKVTEKVNESRKTVQEFINAKKPEEIVFTRNTTEGINLVANSLDLKKGDVVVTTD
ncbi:MAG: aminotransferase class V-fold PLP-dependent enzyme, partial [archaeon]